MTETTAPDGAELTWENPADLVLDDDLLRKDAALDDDFLASIAEGVLEPIVAIRMADGRRKVRMGKRRTLAAIRVGRPAVPVFTVGAEGTAKADRIAHIVGQFHENRQRKNFTAAEDLAGVTALFDLGVSAAQVTRLTRIPKQAVAQVKAVAKSPAAAAAAARYDLTLDQLATVAEFDGDPDGEKAVDALAEAARNGRFDHVAQHLRDTSATRAAYRAAAAELEGAGVRLIARDGDSWQLKLSRWTDADGGALDDETHRDCPGHAAYLTQGWRRDGEGDYETAWSPEYVCTDPEGNGHLLRNQSAEQAKTEADREAELAERRRIRAGNAEWRAAEKVRRKFLAALAGRKAPPKVTPAAVRYVLDEIAAGPPELARAMQYDRHHRLARELLGLGGYSYGKPDELAAAMAQATDRRAEVIALTCVLCAYEATTGVETWRNAHRADAVGAGTRRYFRILEGLGHGLSDVEHLVAYGTRRAAAAAGPGDPTSGDG